MDPHSAAKPELCLCRATTGVFLTRRQASALLSASLICLLLSFMAGFFWGRRQPLQLLTAALAQGQLLQSASEAPTAPSLPVLAQLTGQPDASEAADVAPAKIATPGAALPPVQLAQYRAELGYFNSLKSAQRFAQKLQQAGFTVHVKTRRRTTGAGQAGPGYQVVTEAFAERAPLVQLVNRLQAQAPAAQIKIVSTT